MENAALFGTVADKPYAAVAVPFRIHYSVIGKKLFYRRFKPLAPRAQIRRVAAAEPVAKVGFKHAEIAVIRGRFDGFKRKYRVGRKYPIGVHHALKSQFSALKGKGAFGIYQLI